MFRITIGEWTIGCVHGRLPSPFTSYYRDAQLVEDFTVDARNDDQAVVLVEQNGGKPILVVKQRCPAATAGFYPGLLVVPETNLLFIGAGERLLCYNLLTVQRIWIDEAACGFWRWQRHENMILMSAELELAAWNTQGRKSWSAFVEPPWSYEVTGDRLHLDVMGRKTDFNVESGPDSTA